MGIDFNNLLNQLGKVAASMQNQRDKIDTDSELNTYVSGWDAIKAKANEQNSDNDVNNDVDMATLETQMKSELAGLMGADFGKSKGIETKTEVKDGKEVAVFTDEEALEGLMSALSETMDAEMTAKVAEYNAKHTRHRQFHSRILHIQAHCSNPCAVCGLQARQVTCAVSRKERLFCKA